jgi:phage shock protein A
MTSPASGAKEQDAMGYFGRFTSGVVARIDELIARVENHEALADAALCELQSATARGQARHARVRRDGDALRKALSQEQQAAAQWRERALRQSEDARALECLRRSQHAARKAGDLQQRLAHHEQAERTLAADVSALGERLTHLREQRNMMRARQTCAEALAGVHGGARELDAELAGIFERWELHVAEAEFFGEHRPVHADELARELDDEESQAALRAELARLRGTP